jgi:hypothetical protein
MMTRHDAEGSDQSPSADVSAEKLRALAERFIATLSKRSDQAPLVFRFLIEQHILGRIPKGEEIREQMKAKGQIPQQANAVAPVVDRIRDRLAEYFAKHANENIRILIPKDQYGLVLEPNTVVPDSVPYAQQFWAPHKTPDGTLTIIYTEPLFMRNGAFTEFIRRVDVNARFELPPAQEFCYSHVPLGEVVATLKLVKWFSALGQQTSEEGCRKEIEYEDVMKASNSKSFIVLGAARANGFLSSLQLDANLAINADDDSILVREPVYPEKPSYRESQTAHNVTGYVIVTRLLRMGRCITLFHGNHGQAISRLVAIFLDEVLLRELYKEQLQDFLVSPLSQEFQLLFEVEMDHRGERVPHRTTLVARRPRLGTAKRAG